MNLSLGLGGNKLSRLVETLPVEFPPDVERPSLRWTVDADK